MNTIRNTLEDFECREGFLKCNNGFQCYNATWRCDDKIFCSDGSDEKGCGVHSRWRSRQGVDRDYYLQSMVERSREGDTVAAEWSLCLSGVSTTCDDGRRCFLDFLRCDGQAACADGSDEHHCLNYTCPPEKVKCADLETCVFREYVCDGVRHCADGSDELSCGTPIRQEPRTSTTQRRRPATKRRQLAAPSPRGGGR
ncbi:PREDICTED: very low-density lipoprotein receptor-like [Priapulus caudatus]|uniref:Very low-density lipoprotein receptor-like n=1 Tax=Priapulus caudatus TaxID=37621 RepID=A0ABM1F473_PRICU|nr:PREDICTED: very low-density lipoprotein receptor-like [Priapulus caudatus]